MRAILCCLIAVTTIIYVHAAGFTKATAIYNQVSNTYSIELGVIDVSKVAWAEYNDVSDTEGWGRLHIETNSAFPDEAQAYAAGLLEGVLTSDHILAHYHNMNAATLPNGTMSDEVYAFFATQDKWVTAMVTANSHDSFWRQAHMLQLQWEGLVDGYNRQATASNQLDGIRMQSMNAFGDMFDIIPHVHQDQRAPFHNMSHHELVTYLRLHGHCSAIVRVTPDLSNMFSGHSSWFTYSAMTRLLKSYKLNFTASKTQSVVFASYPATLGSNDDFYVTSAQLNVIETTNGILNNTLYDFVTSSGLLSWQRVAIANRMATSGPQWVSTFSKYNSGTYNNQWIIVDYKLFTPTKPLLPDTLWIAEQIPGYIHAEDRTRDLYFGYWPSYNVPAFEEIYVRAGYPAYAAKYGSEFTWGMCPRAQIYRDRAHTIHDTATMQSFMRYNDWQNDPLAHMNPANAVAARFDLMPNVAERSAGGAYDSKVTSYALASQVALLAVQGPTHDEQPVFEWRDQFVSAPHEGMPLSYGYKWTQFDVEFDQ